MMWKRLKNSKTLYAALGGILVALGMGLSGRMEWAEAGRLIAEGIMVIFLRDGIAKKT